MTTYKSWRDEVKAALREINMPFDDWQKRWPFDFRKEYVAETSPVEAAKKVNRFWWHQQNKAMHQECHKTPNCWLPDRHQGDCQPL
jgi:hypothetical protein